MTEAAWAAGFLVFVAGLVWSLAPLRGPGMPGQGDARAASLRMEKERLKAELRDLELDHRTGKVSREDYEAARGELVLEAVSVMEALDDATSPASRDAEIESWVAAARGRKESR